MGSVSGWITRLAASSGDNASEELSSSVCCWKVSILGEETVLVDGDGMSTKTPWFAAGFYLLRRIAQKRQGKD